MTTSSNRKPSAGPRRARKHWAVLVGACAALALTGVAAAEGSHLSGWEPAQKIDEVAGNDPELNTAAVDGCPIQSPDGLSLYMASSRPGGHGGLDIWVATRHHPWAPWGAPQNLPEPINSAADDFCPTPVGARGLFFVSRRTIEGVTCGMGDIYLARNIRFSGWSEPDHLACAPLGPNSDLDEQGPSAALDRLYFSRSSATVPGDLFVSEFRGGRYGPAAPLVELNDPTANDIQPNVRWDGRELVFSSNRAGGFGGQDIWTSTRHRLRDPWSAPVNLGEAVNTGLGESRPSLSLDARQMLFGRAGPPGTGEGGTGASDIFVTQRSITN
jgi:hypothetical protein